MASPPASSARAVPDLIYATVAGSPLQLDLHLPPGAGPHPLLMWIHGGGWRYGSRSPGRHPEFLVEAGIAVASIDYRLSDRAPWPAQIEDCATAARWLRAHAGAHGIDPERIAVGGESAGGHLAALLGLLPTGHALLGAGPWRPFAAILAVCAVVDFERHLALHAGTPSNQPEMLGHLFADDLAPARLRAASPAHYARADAPPALFVHAIGDPVVAFAPVRELHGALERAGAIVELVGVPGAGHFGLPEMADPSLPARIAGFLRGQLARGR
jgi:acetyl esterase/lipase